MKKFINILKSMLMIEPHYTDLDAYVMAGNPQNSHDVERLEREFYERQYTILSSLKKHY